MKKNIRTRRTWVTYIVWAAILFMQPWGVINGNSRVPMYHNSSGSVSHLNDITSNDTTSKESAVVKHNRKTVATPHTNKSTVKKSNCRKSGCGVFAEISKAEQMMYVYVEGELQHSFPVSTGKSISPTPDMDLRPAGPVYMKYRSKKYPEGDYKGMGNMPYAVFLKGGYAIHGTTPGSFRLLGKRASHGCIRLHPDNAKVFYDLVNSVGLENTWVTVY